MIAGDFFLTRTGLAEEHDTVASLAQRLEAAKTASSVQSKLVAAQSSLAAARQRMAARMSACESWESVLAMLSRVTPASVRLTQVQLGIDAGKPVCRMLGSAPAGSDSTGSLREYTDALTAIPIVKACRLGATQRGEGPRGPVLNFEITLSLVEMPPEEPRLGTMFTSAHTGKEDQP
jgi:Tfp pilus assembly protein PilN